MRIIGKKLALLLVVVFLLTMLLMFANNFYFYSHQTSSVTTDKGVHFDLLHSHKEAGRIGFVSPEQRTLNDHETIPHVHREMGHRIVNIVHCSSSRHLKTNSSIVKDYPYFNDGFNVTEEPIVSWLDTRKRRVFCDGNMVLFDNRFGLLHDVVMRPSLRADTTKALGGEEVRLVLNQQEAAEKFVFKKGFWEMSCSEEQTGSGASSHALFGGVKFVKETNTEEAIIQKHKGIEIENTPTIAVVRGDYANLHNFVMGIYNAFLLMKVFQLQPHQVSILVLDAHPYCELDEAWKTLYGSFKRVGHIQGEVFYRTLIWAIGEGQGPVTMFERKSLPYTEEFRAFVLNQHGLSDVTPLRCPNLTITVNLRRNKVFHPRNVAGSVGRKIFNEAELIGAIMKAFPDACVQGSLMDSLPMSAQLDITRNTDIFIGMHGAGMSHTMFLPKHAGVLELFSKDFKKGRHHYLCFERIAQWKGMKYDSWENFDASREMPHEHTIVPVDLLIEKLRVLVDRVCKE